MTEDRAEEILLFGNACFSVLPAAALKGHKGRKLSRCALMRHAITIVEAQITLAEGARLALDALEQVRRGRGEQADD